MCCTRVKFWTVGFLPQLIGLLRLQVYVCGTVIAETTINSHFSYFSYLVILSLYLLAQPSPKENTSCYLITRTVKILYPKLIRFYETSIFQFGSMKTKIQPTYAIGIKSQIISFSVNSVIELFFCLVWLMEQKMLQSFVVS